MLPSLQRRRLRCGLLAGAILLVPDQEDFSGWFINNQRFSGANVAGCINTVCTNRDTELMGRILS